MSSILSSTLLGLSGGLISFERRIVPDFDRNRGLFCSNLYTLRVKVGKMGGKGKSLGVYISLS